MVAEIGAERSGGDLASSTTMSQRRTRRAVKDGGEKRRDEEKSRGGRLGATEACAYLVIYA